MTPQSYSILALSRPPATQYMLPIGLELLTGRPLADIEPILALCAIDLHPAPSSQSAHGRRNSFSQYPPRHPLHAPSPAPGHVKPSPREPDTRPGKELWLGYPRRFEDCREVISRGSTPTPRQSGSDSIPCTLIFFIHLCRVGGVPLVVSPPLFRGRQRKTIRGVGSQGRAVAGVAGGERWYCRQLGCDLRVWL